MNILVLQESPRKKGSTAGMVNAFRCGAEAAGHTVNVIFRKAGGTPSF